NYLDWQNDYFVITNKHLIHREFDLRKFSTNVIKIPIDQIQSVEISKPNLLSNLFNFGTARVTTAAQAGIVYFDNIDAPTMVRDTLNRLSQRVKTLDAGREQAIMRESLESHFQADHPLSAVTDDNLAPIAAPKQTGLFTRYQWRLEEGDTITYRKHIFVLLRESAWPGGIVLGLIVLYLLLTRFFNFTFSQLWIIFSLFFLVDLGWLIWKVEDWRNDIFQVTSRVIIDIDRRPFGFGESRKQAPLGNIQNVSADRPGILQTLFNFGNVFVETAGVDANITFEDVPNPSQIQSDIFKRLDEVRQAQRVKEGAQRRKEYAVLLDVYKQALEQGRIPQRTPPPNEFGYEN
ncbi:MAG: PH domain-containing protein, partial [Anaerolineales bacterium]|nr:PH domain-containing protein [Anaerolineales bacterium]